MNISIVKHMFDDTMNKIMELENDCENEDVQMEIDARRDAFWYIVHSHGILSCGYSGSTFVVCYEDDRLETI